LGVIYLSAIFAINKSDAKVFVMPGNCFSQCDKNATCGDDDDGYDGQFAYYIARDPADGVNCLDEPAYRMQRILLPALGRVISLGQEALIPWAFVLINLTALAISTALVESLLISEHASRWFALSYGLFFGVVIAVRLSTTEPLAYALVIAGVWYARRERVVRTAVLLALAALAKEMTLLFVAGYGLYLVLHKRWRDAVIMGFITGLPFALWQLVLYVWLGEFGIGSGGALATPFEIIPYNGVWRIAWEGGIAAFLLLGVLLVIPAAVLPSVWGLWHSLRDMRRSTFDLYTCLLLANAAIMPFVPFSTYREFLGILRFIPGLVLMVMLYAARYEHRRSLVYSTLWIPLLLFLLVG